MASNRRDRGVVEAVENGPLKVTGAQVTNSRGEGVETQETAYLCRCGASGNKPFCDGSHVGIGFSGDPSDGRQPDRRDDYAGARISIHDNRGLCSHAGHCTDNLATVFRMGTEPWIDPDGAGVDEIVRVIGMCPSGALSYSIDGVEHRDRPADPEVHITRNGPYHVHGEVAFDGHDWGDGASREHYALCRCGTSGNKPLCDGSHWYAGFADDEGKTISAAARSAASGGGKAWHRVAAAGEPAEGTVVKGSAGAVHLALSRTNGTVGALAHRCPHQGGPLEEGSIEDGALRCPWHGYRFDPRTGDGIGRAEKARAFPADERPDGVHVEVEEPRANGWTVSHVMAETMVNWGITHVFGMVGHSNLGLAEAIRVQEERGKLTYIGIRHEGAAAFACSGFAKASGRSAACLTIAGPGATNLLTGLWDAHMDRAPVLALTGQVKSQVLGPNNFQEVDLASAFQAVAPFSHTVLHDSKHAELMSLAIKNALVRRNVGHLIFPDEVQVLDAGDQAPGHPEGRIDSTRIAPPDESLDLAMYRLWKAKRPAIIAGYGARDGMDEVLALAEALHAPVMTTFKGKGNLPEDHPLAGGVLGRSGTPIGSAFMDEADLLIVFGATFSDHTGIDASRPIVQVDFDRMSLGKSHPVDSLVWGDIGVTAALMREKLGEWAQPEDRRALIRERRLAWREEKARRAAVDHGDGIHSAAIFAALTRQAPADAVIAVDVGNNTYSFGRYFECQHQRVIMSGYLGSIGFSFPAAMGAWCAMPDRKVLSVGGDGGFGQYMGDFTTAVKYGMDITHVLLNNSELGKISKEQTDGGWPVWKTELHNPDFAQYAELCGGLGIRVTEPGQLDAAMEKAIAHPGPALVEILSDPLLW